MVKGWKAFKEFIREEARPEVKKVADTLDRAVAAIDLLTSSTDRSTDMMETFMDKQNDINLSMAKDIASIKGHLNIVSSHES